MRHLHHLVNQEHVKHKWVDDTVLPIIQFIINNQYNRDSGTVSQFFSAFALIFGTLCHERFDYHTLNDHEYKTAFVAKLNGNFRALRKARYEYQQEIVARRLARHNTPSALYVGDFFVRDQLNFYYRRPYEVRAVENNKVELRYLATTDLITEHIERLKYFKGTIEEAQRSANNDAEQFFIKRIRFYIGDPEPNQINLLGIEVEFEDSDIYFLGCEKISLSLLLLWNTQKYTENFTGLKN